MLPEPYSCEQARQDILKKASSDVSLQAMPQDEVAIGARLNGHLLDYDSAAHTGCSECRGFLLQVRNRLGHLREN